MHFTLRLPISTVALALLAAAAPQPVGRRINRVIPITEHSGLVNADNSINFDAIHAHLTSIEAKIHRGFSNFEENTGSIHPSALNVSQKRGAGESLTNYDGAYWYGTISAGTPARSFTVIFDTSVSELLLPAKHCQNCGDHSRYDPPASSTARELHRTFFFRDYGEEAPFTSGEQYTDSVSIIGYTATTQTLDAATSYASVLRGLPSDGLMGMGFKSISKHATSPVFQTLVSERQVTDPVFSFLFSSAGGELYIGGSNPAQYSGSFSYARVTHKGFWQVTMDNVQLHGRVILSNIDTIINTGAAVVIGHPDQVETLYKDLDARRINYYGADLYTFPCNAFPTISFAFGGKKFPFHELNLGTLPHDHSRCVSALVGREMGTKFWTVGTKFLSGVYTEFDVGNNRVGFAQRIS